MPGDTEANWIGRGKPSIYDDASFDYRYNEYGFRCDSMANPLQHQHRVLWAGCSLTEGIGLPVDALWSHLMTQRLRAALRDPHMPYWSVARGARGQDWIARQLSMMIPVLRPQMVIAHLPDPGRRELWSDGKLCAWQAGDAHMEQLGRRIVGIWDDDQIVHDSQRAIVLIHTACRAAGSAFRWHMWLHGHGDCDAMYQRIRQGLPDDIQACHYASAPGGGDVARDGMHGGPGTHRDFVDALWAEIGTDLLANLR